VRVFAGHEQARAAITALEAAGIEARAISVLAPSAAEARALDRETGAAEDLQKAVRAHPLRDLLDWLGRIEAVAVPGFASVLATGDLGLHLARSSPARGAITAALVDLGVPVDEAAQLERAVHDGRILVVVHGGPLEVEAAQTVLEMNAR
jgi:hypothetical protein